MTNKKGQTTEILAGIVSTLSILVMLFVLSSISGDITKTIQDTQLTEAATTQQLTLLNSSNASLANVQGISGSDSVVNASSGTALVRNVNYTIDFTARTISINTTSTTVTGVYNVSYRYTINTLPGNITEDGLMSQGKLATFYPTIGLLMGAIALMAILIGGFLFLVGRGG